MPAPSIIGMSSDSYVFVIHSPLKYVRAGVNTHSERAVFFDKGFVWTRRDAVLRPTISRASEDNLKVYGARNPFRIR